MPVDKVRALQEKLYQAAKTDRERRFHSLRDKLWRRDVLEQAWVAVKQNQGAEGVDRVTIQSILDAGEAAFLNALQDELRTGTYRVNNVRRAFIPKRSGGERALGIPTVKDRVVQGAVKLLLEPVFEADFEEFSYGFRPGRSCQDACLEVYKWLNYGLENVLDADLEACFDSIPHDKLMREVERRISDGYVLGLLRAWLNAGVLEEGVVRDPVKGTPQGGVISPLLANIYLHRLDAWWRESGMMNRSGCNAQLVRYADDFVILSSGSLEVPLAKLEGFLAQLGLRLKPEKTRLVHARDGFDFLSFRFQRRFSRKRSKWVTYMFPTPAAMKRARVQIRERTKRELQSIRSDAEVVEDLNRFLRGWGQYYSHTHARSSFRRVQVYCNQKLRRFLRSRRGLPGFGYGEYPDEVLHKGLGLYDLRAGQIRYVMS